MRRYYIQESPFSIRRYTAGTAERWIGGVWNSEGCAPERTCWTSGDERLTEEQFRARYPKIPV